MGRSGVVRRALAVLGAAVLVGAGLVGAGSTAAASPVQAEALPTPRPSVPLPAAVDDPTPYLGAVTCDYVAKPGVLEFAALIQATYAGTGSYGIVNSCPAEGMVSEHTEGRAWDWAVSVNDPTQAAQAQALLSWLVADNATNARRLGIMYIIWNRQIWGVYNQAGGWQPYSCSGVTACHQDHVHFSFSWNGAYARTSWWTGTVTPTDYGPCVGPGQTFALPDGGRYNPKPCPSWTPLAARDPLVASLLQYGSSTLAPGSSGAAVATLQLAVGGTAPDGSYGPMTIDLVTTFQRRHGLPATGTATPATWAVLIATATGGAVHLGDPPPQRQHPQLQITRLRPPSWPAPIAPAGAPPRRGTPVRR